MVGSRLLIHFLIMFNNNMLSIFAIDIGLVSSFSYFRTPQLTKDLDNYISNHASEKIASQFLRYMFDQSGFPGYATGRESSSSKSVNKINQEAQNKKQELSQL